MNKKSMKMTGMLLAAVCFFSQAAAFGISQTTALAREQTYKEEHTASIDLNGDGSNETVRFLPGSKSYDEFETLTISVNGTEQATLREGMFSYDYRVLKLKNGKHLLYVRTFWNNEDGLKYVYDYRGGKLVRILDVGRNYDARWATDPKVQGNRILFGISGNGAGIGYYDFEDSYTWKDGKLKEDSKVHKVKKYFNMNTGKTGVLDLTVTKSFKIYSDEKCKKYKATVPVGAHVKVTKTFQEKKYATYYVTGEGYSGWYTSKDVDWEMLFDGVTGVA